MKRYCPFASYGKFECVYRDDGYICDDIDVCPGNTDSMCGGFVQANLETKERQFTSANKQSDEIIAKIQLYIDKICDAHDDVRFDISALSVLREVRRIILR